MSKPVARLTTPAQMVASIPLQLGYVPTESLVVWCLHEPRGRVGLTMRLNLPAAGCEAGLVDEVVDRVRDQRASRVLIAVYTGEPDGLTLPRTTLVAELKERFEDLRRAELFLVRHGRVWTYFCAQPCCPPEGRPVEEATGTSPVQLLAAENVLQGRVVLPDREALEDSLAGPVDAKARVARERCEIAATLLADVIGQAGVAVAAEASLQGWRDARTRFANPPGQLEDLEAAALAMSLVDVQVRDFLVASPRQEVPSLLGLLHELVRRTPAPYDAPVCTLLAWLTYCQGGGAVVTIALERALATDPDYSLATLLDQALWAQLPPDRLRRLTRRERPLPRRGASGGEQGATRRGRR